MTKVKKSEYPVWGDCGALEAIVMERIAPQEPGWVLYDGALWPSETAVSASLEPGSVVDVVGHCEHRLQVIPRIPAPVLT